MTWCARPLAVLGLLLLVAPVAAEEEELTVEKGRRVSIEYTMKLADGTVLDTNVGGEPLAIPIGSHEALPAVENVLIGMKVNESKTVTLSPEEGYGPIDETRIQEVPIEKIPEDSREVGSRLVAHDPSGDEHVALVREVKESTVIIDLNHPLAGKALEFDLKVISIE